VPTEQEAIGIIQASELCRSRGRPADGLRLLRQLLDLIGTITDPWVPGIGLRMYVEGSQIHDALDQSKDSRGFLLTLLPWLRKAALVGSSEIISAAEPVLSASEAKLLREQGCTDLAIASFLTSLARLENSRPLADEWELGVRCELASLLCDAGRLSELRDVVTLAHSRRRGLEPSARLAGLSILQGDAALMAVDLESALEAFQVAHDQSKALHDPICQATALERISFAHRHATEKLTLSGASLEISFSTRREAIILYQTAGNTSHEQEARTQLVHTLVYAQRWDEAILECVTAAERCVICKDSTGACSFIAHAGHIASLIGRENDAASYYREAIDRYGNAVSEQLVGRIRAALAALVLS
jgi:tetratricopeptide (TPR) repeat protein